MGISVTGLSAIRPVLFAHPKNLLYAFLDQLRVGMDVLAAMSARWLDMFAAFACPSPPTAEASFASIRMLEIAQLGVHSCCISRS